MGCVQASWMGGKRSPMDTLLDPGLEFGLDVVCGSDFGLDLGSVNGSDSGQVSKSVSDPVFGSGFGPDHRLGEVLSFVWGPVFSGSRFVAAFGVGYVIATDDGFASAAGDGFVSDAGDRVGSVVGDGFAADEGSGSESGAGKSPNFAVGDGSAARVAAYGSVFASPVLPFLAMSIPARWVFETAMLAGFEYASPDPFPFPAAMAPPRWVSESTTPEGSESNSAESAMPEGSPRLSDSSHLGFGLAKSQIWLLEWIKERLKNNEDVKDEDHSALMKGIEGDFRWINLVARGRGSWRSMRRISARLAWLLVGRGGGRLMRRRMIERSTR